MCLVNAEIGKESRKGTNLSGTTTIVGQVRARHADESFFLFVFRVRLIAKSDKQKGANTNTAACKIDRTTSYSNLRQLPPFLQRRAHAPHEYGVLFRDRAQ